MMTALQCLLAYGTTCHLPGMSQDIWTSYLRSLMAAQWNARTGMSLINQNPGKCLCLG